jgi:hypothetical protein
MSAVRPERERIRGAASSVDGIVDHRLWPVPSAVDSSWAEAALDPRRVARSVTGRSGPLAADDERIGRESQVHHQELKVEA